MSEFDSIRAWKDRAYRSRPDARAEKARMA